MAEAIGCTVAELLSRISSAELTEWIEYLKLKHKRQLEAAKGK